MFTGEIFLGNRFFRNKQFGTIFTFCIACCVWNNVVRAHSCAAPCDQSRCENPTNCPGGTTEDPCGCCLACARVANETCGGKFGLLGQCDEGLVCLLKVQIGHPITGDEEGICKEPRETCSTLRSYSGCNKVDMQCVCSTISTCDDPLFEHNTRHECQAALARLLDEESEIDRCEDANCPEDDIECPDDSYRLPSLVESNKCCSIPRGCDCLPCSKPDCPKDSQIKLEKQAEGKPGSCCPVYKCVNASELRCTYEGHDYPNGHTWRVNKCQTCECRDGLTFCKDTMCQPLHECGQIEVPEGECCPVCTGCVTRSGSFYNNSETWKEDDYCTTCTCEEGQISCQSELCYVACTNPVHIPGQCCSVCPDPTVITIPPECPVIDNCTIQCSVGLKKDDYGCYECKCKLEECNLECPNGFAQDANGQDLCQCSTEETPPRCPSLADCKTDCRHGFAADANGCPTCKCRCKQRKCDLQCAYGYQSNDRDCPICKCRQKSPKIHSTTTTNSHVTITTRPTTKPAHKSEGIACYSSEGKQFDVGQTWHDGCRICYCHKGQEMCALITCPVPACEHPIVTAGECCPKCLDDEIGTTRIAIMAVCQAIDGHHYAEGETWEMDSCTRCICHEGRVLCNTQQCPPTPCPKPVKKQGECCASCAGFVNEPVHAESNTVKLPCYSGDGRTAYQHGNSWRASVCQSCVCQHGKIKCYSDSCPKPTCLRPVLRKNQCCPICLDKDMPPPRCESEDRVYSNGERWNASDCIQCMCLAGRIKCTEKLCSVACDNPINIPGQCCPICTGKSPRKNDVNFYPKLDISTPLVNHSDVRNKMTSVQDDTFKVQTHSQSPFNEMAVISCSVIIFLLLLIICGLLYLQRRNTRQLRLKEQELKIARLKPRPKSTNLEFQGAMGPFLTSNGSMYLEKNKCGNDNEYSKPLMGSVNTYVPPVKNVV